MSDAKKARTALSELEQSHAAHLGHLEAIRSHLSAIPGVPADSPAARAVRRSVDEEVRRSTREYKLRRKFERERIQNLGEAAAAAAAAGGNGEDMNDDDDVDDGWQDVTPPRTSPGKSDGDALTGGSPANEGDLRSSPVQLMEASSESLVENHHDGSSSRHSNNANPASPLGQALAELVTRSVADARIRVSNPAAAVALALHAAMRTDVLGFKCTGLPPDEEDAKRGGGFAAPIRELPRTKFLPDGWDETKRSTCSADNKTTRISLRYRKDGLGSTVLRVTELESAMHDQPCGAIISIAVTSSTNSEPAAATLTAAAAGTASADGGGRSFDASQHINLAGLAAAITSERQRLGIGPTSDVEVKVSPVLHYLDLAGLMTTFVTSFDLGAIRDLTMTEEEKAAVAAAAGNNTSMKVDGGQQSGPYRKQMDPSSGNQIPPIPTPAVPAVANPPRLPTGPGIPQPGRAPRIEDLDPSLRRPGPGGDFGGDLAPGGILDPRRGMSQEDNRGMIMGPNHPAFRRPGIGGDDDEFGGYGLEDPRMPHIGGTGMAPRFDPYYPPGVGPDLGRGDGGRGMGRGGRGGRGRGRRPPPSGGDPNPYHLQPPNSFNSDMFM